MQLQPTEIFGAIKHILGGTAGEEEVDEGLASMAVDWVDQAFVSVAPLGDNSMGTLQIVK